MPFMPGMPLGGAVTVITGASSGIGRAAARRFARQGARVVLASRNEPRLRALQAEIASYPAEAFVVATDVTNDEQVLSLVRMTLARFGSIDILICNAGVGLYSDVASLPPEALRRVFEVNYFGVVRCVQAALPSMLERRSGLIQIISSIIGRRSLPGYSGYCATKFALYALAESLRVELRGTGVTVQTVYPSLTATEFSDNCIIRKPGETPGAITAMTAEQVARRMVQAARRGTRDSLVGIPGRLLVWLNRLSPSLTDAILARAMRPTRRTPAGRSDAVPD